MTMTPPEADVDLDALAALDWQHETPCTISQCRHDRPPARWRVVYACACVSLLCQPCKGDLEEALGSCDDSTLPLSCGVCGLSWFGRIRDIVAILEPLP